MKPLISLLAAALLPTALFGQSFPIEPGGGGGGGSGTVTSVGATSSSAALSITGSPIAVSGTFAFSLDADLTALAALTGTNTIYYRSADGVWSPVTFSGLTFSGGLLTATGGGGSGDMLAANNLSELTNKATARTNLQLNTPTGWLATDNLVTVGAPIANLSDVRIDSGSALGVRISPGGSATNASINLIPKGTGAAQLAEIGLNYGFLVSNSGMQFTYAGVSYLATPAGLSLLDDADAAAQRATLGVAINATGFNGNLATTDDTVQEVAQKLDDLIGTGGDVTLSGAQTITGAKAFDAPITINKNYIAPDEPMASTDIDTSEMHNTVSSAADVTLTFDTAPAAGAEFGVRLTNTDAVAHIWTIPSTYSEILGVPRTLLLIQPGVAYSLRFRHEGSGVYRMWGDPIDYSDYPADVPATTDTTIFYQTASGLYRRTTVDDLLSVYDTMTATLENKTMTDSTNVFADSVQIMCSDMTTAITAAGNKAYWRPPFAVTVTDVRASAFTAPTGAAIIIDIEEEGTSILDANRLQIDATESFSDLGEPVISDASVADNALVTIDFDQVGSTVAGAGILVTIFYTYSPH